MLSAFGLILPSASAADFTWVAANAKPFTTGTAWSSNGTTGTVPGASDNVDFVTGGGSGIVEVNSSVTVANLSSSDTGGPVFDTLNGSTGILTVTGTVSTTAATGPLTFRNGNNTGGLLNFAGNVVSNTGFNLFFGSGTFFLNSYSASTTILNSGTGGSIGFAVTGTASLGDIVAQNGTINLEVSTMAGTVGNATAKSLSGSGTGAFIGVSGNPSSTNIATLTLTNSGTSSVYYGELIDGASVNNHLNLIMNGSGTQVLAGINTYTGTTQIQNGTLQLGDGATSKGSLHVGGSVILSPAGTLAYANVGAQIAGSSISGTGSVNILSGTTVFSGGVNTYAGTTTVNSGATLQVGASGTTGSLSNNSSVVNNGSVNFAGMDSVTYSGTISGAGAVGQIGTGTTTLAGNNTYTGATTVSTGSLLVTGGLSSSTAVTVAGGATLGVGLGAGGGAFKTLAVHSLDTGSGVSGLESVIKLNIGTAGQNDAITMGAFNLNGQPVNLVLATAGVTSGSYTLMTWTSGGFTDLTTQLDLAGSSLGINLSDFLISGDSLIYTVPAPEPTSLALLGAASLAVVLFRRHRSDS